MSSIPPSYDESSRREPLHSRSERRLLVAIPCLNEALTVAGVIRQIPKNISGLDRVDVVVIDDGSTDATVREAESVGAFVIKHRRNLGVGRAFLSAVNYAISQGYDIMVNIDGDGQFSPLDITLLVKPVEQGLADMATASRFLDRTLIPEMPKAKLVGNYMMSYLISRLVRQRFFDVSCGFRCYSREALLQLNLHGAFTYTQETFLYFAVNRMSILEVPLSVRYFPDRRSRVASSLIKYAISAAKIIFRGYRDYFPLRFFWAISAIFAVPAFGFGLRFLYHYLTTGLFSGYLYAGFCSAFLFVMATTFFVLGIVADMLDRIRANQDRILYRLKILEK